MSKAEKKIVCPACAHEFSVQPDADLLRLTCPRCEAEIPEDALRGMAELAEELAPGFRPGQRLGNYVIESLLGSGGMAVVFGGRQLSLNRYVAIKILPKEFAKNRLFVDRFESEAAVLASLNHPNIVHVIDRGCEGETYFIVMEYVEGETLKDCLRRQGHLAPEQVFPIAEQVLAALEYAHRRGVVHRDIKPGNIIINREGLVKIADFGLAHLAKSQGGQDATRDNQTMGTLKYVAPEQLTSAKNIDGRADLYSFGVCLYEMLTGKLPLGTFKMPSECDNTLDVRWDDIILRSLKMDADERFGAAEEMTRAVREVATTPRMTSDQREEQEEAEVRAKVEVSLTACASCGHESKPTARQCDLCGASLADLFDLCPGCRVENRVDVARCPGCGSDLASYRARMRKAAEAIQARAKQLASERQFDLALVQLSKLGRFRTREYASIRESARIWIERIRRRRERYYQRTFEAGERVLAEGRAEQALEIWGALPENYGDAAARRKEILAKMDEAKAAQAEGNRLYRLGDIASAVVAWKKAASFWPRDHELRKQIAAARIQLGNLNLKRSYLKESQEAAARGNIIEALALCRKVLELHPDDSTALALAKELEAKGREFAESEARAAPKVRLRRARAQRALSKLLSPQAIGLIAGATGVVVLLLIIIFVYLPASHRAREETAVRLFGEAAALKQEGKITEALKRCSSIVEEYSDTPSAQKASSLAKELRALNAEVQVRCEQADSLASKGDLASLVAGFKKYEELLSGPPVTAVEVYRDYATRRIEELRAGIALSEAGIAAECEKRGEWQEAFLRYRQVAEEYGFSREPILSKLAQARKRLDSCAADVNAGRLAAEAGKWNEAYHAAVSALRLVPTDPDAGRLLSDIAPKLTPPHGMVLAPPGKYIVGGAEGNPRRTVVLPHGFFIDIGEVSLSRFAEFLRATGRGPPPGWGENGLPPPGTEGLPVVNVTWEDAAAFAAWANRTLPTEEQWECACRGPSGQSYPWGEVWEATAAVLGYGPARTGNAAKDRSPYGCLDMAGNVAEWTATRLETTLGVPTAPPSPVGAPRDGAGPGKPTLYVVKGSSWAGIEKDRPTTVVVSPLADRRPDAPLLLVPDPKTPEWAVRYRSNVEIQYLGVVVAEETAYEYTLVRRWMPTWDQWAESKFQVMPGQAVGEPASVTVEEESLKSRRRNIPVDFSTGCVPVRHEPKAWLEVRDPAGVLRRFPFVIAGPLRLVRISDYKEPPSLPEMTLERTVGAPMRMAGRADGRYINVGFRCVKMLWTPPSVEEAEQVPGKN